MRQTHRKRRPMADFDGFYAKVIKVWADLAAFLKGFLTIGMRIRPTRNGSAFSKYRGIGNPEIASGSLEKALEHYLHNVMPPQHLARPAVMDAFEQSVASSRALLERLAKSTAEHLTIVEVHATNRG